MLSNPSKKRVTIDDLARMVARGFSETKIDIEALDVKLSGRMDVLEEKVDSLDKKVDRIDSRLTNQLDYVLLHYTRRSEYELLSKRVTKLERK